MHGMGGLGGLRCIKIAIITFQISSAMAAFVCFQLSEVVGSCFLLSGHISVKHSTAESQAFAIQSEFEMNWSSI